MSFLSFSRFKIVSMTYLKYKSVISTLIVMMVSPLNLFSHKFLIFRSNFFPFPAGDLINDFFFGRLAQPVVFDMDLKSFLTTRVLGSLYCCFLFSALARQRLVLGQSTPALLCCAGLQLVYWLRRAWLDPCQPSSLDNQQDRAGFCRIWGALVLLPALYVTPIALLAHSARSPGSTTCCFIFLAGLSMQLLTSAIDEQRREFRRCNGDMKLDSKDPYYITAKFRREGGEAATNILLGECTCFWLVFRL